MFKPMTNIPKEWFKDPSRPWRGVHRRVSIEYTLPLGAWPNVRKIIAGTPSEDMSKRAFFPKVTLSCAQCSATFVRTVAEAKKSGPDTFCGPRCSTTFTNTKAGKVGPFCNICGAKMLKAEGSRQCSDACRAALKDRMKEALAARRLNLPVTSCEECGVSVKQRTRSQTKRYCSVACKNTAHAKRMTADGNPGWRGGVDQTRYLPGVLTEYNKIRPQVVERDGGACVVCHSSDGLSVHHLDMDAANNSPSNLVTLCRDCHSAVHAAERSKQPSIPWPWLKTYAETKSSMTSK